MKKFVKGAATGLGAVGVKATLEKPQVGEKFRFIKNGGGGLRTSFRSDTEIEVVERRDIAGFVLAHVIEDGNRIYPSRSFKWNPENWQESKKCQESHPRAHETEASAAEVATPHDGSSSNKRGCQLCGWQWWA